MWVLLLFLIATSSTSVSDEDYCLSCASLCCSSGCFECVRGELPRGAHTQCCFGGCSSCLKDAVFTSSGHGMHCCSGAGERCSGCPELLLTRSDGHLRAGEFVKALDTLNLIRAMNDTLVGVNNRIGDVYLAMGRAGEAVAAYATEYSRVGMVEVGSSVENHPWLSLVAGLVVRREDGGEGQAVVEGGSRGSKKSLLAALVSLGSRVVQVGAGSGVETVQLARQVGGEGTVVALEAQRTLFHELCANLALSAVVSSVKALHAVAASESGKLMSVPKVSPTWSHVSKKVVALYLSKARLKASSASEALDDHDSATEDVQTVAVDDLPMGRVDLLLVGRVGDGMVDEVIKGAAEVILKKRPVLLVTMDQEDEGAKRGFERGIPETITRISPNSHRAVKRILKTNLYQCFWLREPLPQGRSISLSLFCLPSGHGMIPAVVKGGMGKLEPKELPLVSKREPKVEL
jgi:FkbM family methyltransferase